MTKRRTRVIYCYFNIKLGTTMSLKDDTKNNNADQIETRLASLGLNLPEPLKLPPDIQTPFAWVRIRGNQAYISGHGPQNPDGSIAGPFGKVGGEEVSLEESAKLTGMSILGSLKRELGSLDLVTAWLHVRGMVNVIPGFVQTTNVINGFSDLILKLYGREVGMRARSAVGVQSLALDVPLIIECVVEIKVR
jgi:enamine deaminase RidA (YjgF/YER057c/UK114 family)